MRRRRSWPPRIGVACIIALAALSGFIPNTAAQFGTDTPPDAVILADGVAMSATPAARVYPLFSSDGAVAFAIAGEAGVSSVQLTLAGLQPSSTYAVFRDLEPTAVSFIVTDQAGLAELGETVLEPHVVKLSAGAAIAPTVLDKATCPAGWTCAADADAGYTMTAAASCQLTGSVVIAANDVVVDFNGCSLTPSSSPSADLGVVIAGDRVTIRNLSISGTGTCIVSAGREASRVENITCDQQSSRGVALIDGADPEIEGLAVTGTGGPAVMVRGESALLRDIVVDNVVGSGVWSRMAAITCSKTSRCRTPRAVASCSGTSRAR